MSKSILVIASILLFTCCFAQVQYIGLNKFFVKKSLKKMIKRQKFQTELMQTDSSIVYLLRDTSRRDMDMIIYFDQSGICNKVKETYDCDSCFQIVFHDILNEKRFEWTEILANTYLSKFSKKLLLFKNPNAPFSYILQHNKYMTRKQYDD